MWVLLGSLVWNVMFEDAVVLMIFLGAQGQQHNAINIPLSHAMKPEYLQKCSSIFDNVCIDITQLK